MKKQVLFFSFLLISASFNVSAAQGPSAIGKAYNLLPTEPTVLKQLATKSEKATACGAYFIRYGDLTAERPFLSFQYTTNEDGVSKFQLLLVLRENLYLKVEPTKTTPTVTYDGQLDPNDPRRPHLTIQISQKDLDAARTCFPQPPK